MTKHVDVPTLQEWLDARLPATILDVRSAEDRAQWVIPGSLHVDAYEARSFAVFREFARANGMNEEGMLDHLKLIPRQVVGIVKENPAVLNSYDTFWAALAGPD